MEGVGSALQHFGTQCENRVIECEKKCAHDIEQCKYELRNEYERKLELERVQHKDQFHAPKKEMQQMATKIEDTVIKHTNTNSEVKELADEAIIKC